MADLTITLTLSDVSADIKQELSFVAKRMTDDKGNLLYDGLVPHTRDIEMIEKGIGDSCRSIFSAMSDVCSVKENTAGTGIELKFLNPDRDTNIDGDTEKEVVRCIVFRGCADWLSTRVPEVAKYYVQQFSDSLERLNALVRHRKPLSRV